jgi:hypothetical protein
MFSASSFIAGVVVGIVAAVAIPAAYLTFAAERSQTVERPQESNQSVAVFRTTIEDLAWIFHE